MARQAYLSGDPVVTYAIASKISTADPGDVEALLLLSASTEALGHPRVAFAFGKRAWAEAQKAKRATGLRFDIAQQTAHAALSAGNFRGAALWLGRAVDLAPNPDVRSQRQADRRRIESLVRLSFSADLQVSPTDNLNNGATTGLLIVQDQVVGRISGWSVAHAGILTYGKIGADYALGVTGSGKARNSLGVAISATLHRLTAPAAAADPKLQGADLDLWTTSLHWTQERFLDGAAFAGRPTMRLTLEASQNWFAGQPYSPTLRGEIEVPLTMTQGPDDLSLVATLERQWQDAPSGVVTGASLHLQGLSDLTLPWAKGQLGYGFGATVLRSDWSNTTSDSLDASLTLDPGLPAGPVHSRFGIGVS